MRWKRTRLRSPRHDASRSPNGAGGSAPGADSSDPFPSLIMTASVITGPAIDRFRTYTLLCALKLELKGLKRSGRSAYSIIKTEYNLKGSRQSVHDQLQSILAS